MTSWSVIPDLLNGFKISSYSFPLSYPNREIESLDERFCDVKKNS